MKIKFIRYMTNLFTYILLLNVITYILYIIPADLYVFKNTIIPLGQIFVLNIFISMVLAAVNEITSIFLVRYFRGKR